MKPVEVGVTGYDPSVVTQPAEQLRYALWLDWGTRVGLVVLVLVFLAYGLGMTTPHVPLGLANIAREWGGFSDASALLLARAFGLLLLVLGLRAVLAVFTGGL